jgi:hypothetical protein
MKKELGNQKATETFTLAKNTMKMFADDKLWSFLNDTHLGDCPELITLFAKVGAAFGEENFRGQPPGPGGDKGKINLVNGDPERVERLYPSMQKK